MNSLENDGKVIDIDGVAIMNSVEIIRRLSQPTLSYVLIAIDLESLYI